VGYLQSRTAGAAGAPSSLAYSANVTPGSWLVVGVLDDSGTPTSVTSNVDGALTQIGVTQNAPGQTRCALFAKENAVGGATTITVTHAGAFVGMQILEYSGVLASGSADQTTGGTGTSATPSSGATGATTQASEIAIGFCVNDSSGKTWTAGAGYTLREANANGQFQVEEQVLSATGAQTAGWTMSASDGWAATIGTFKTGVATTIMGPRFSRGPWKQRRSKASALGNHGPDVRSSNRRAFVVSAAANQVVDVTPIVLRLAPATTTVALGGVTAALTAAALRLAPATTSTVVGGVSIPLTAVALRLAAPSTTVAVGGITAALNAAVLRLAVATMTTSTGPVTVALSAAALRLAVAATTEAMGGVIVVTTPTALRLAVPSHTVTLGANIAALTPVALRLALPTVNVVAGAVVAVANAVALRFAIPATTVTSAQVVNATPVVLRFAAPATTITTGPTAIALEATALRLAVATTTVAGGESPTPPPPTFIGGFVGFGGRRETRREREKEEEEREAQVVALEPVVLRLLVPSHDVTTSAVVVTEPAPELIGALSAATDARDSWQPPVDDSDDNEWTADDDFAATLLLWESA
jgi:hypothetical protein